MHEKIDGKCYNLFYQCEDGSCFMDLWFTENHSKHAKFSIRVEKQLASVESDYQRIDIFETPEFGRVLVMDSCIMLTEKDEFIYHEMLVHVPMAVHPNIKKVLLIGAGDGGSLRELCFYKNVERIDLVEIDPLIIELCKEYLPQTACCFDDPRLNIFIEDGLKFVRNKSNEYDLIVVDSTDPFGPGEGLFTKEFYGNCYKLLKDDGILVNQHESPYYEDDALAVQRTYARTSHFFPITELYQAHVPTYPSGHWLFGFSSKKYHPIKDLDEKRWLSYGIADEMDYYNTAIHKGAFALPNYVLDLIGKKINMKEIERE